jgi:phosphodiesterase/alkaline phosphatase D-like protein
VQIYRNFEIGKLIKLIMLDTRVIGEDRQLGSFCSKLMIALTCTCLAVVLLEP